MKRKNNKSIRRKRKKIELSSAKLTSDEYVCVRVVRLVILYCSVLRTEKLSKDLEKLFPVGKKAKKQISFFFQIEIF